MPKQAVSGVAVVALIVLITTIASAQVKVQNAAEMKFAAIPGAPACFTMSVERGDPGTGPVTMFIKGTRGCDAPMHFHNVTEQLMMVSGTGYLQMKGDDQVHTLRAGAFATAPPKHAHHFTCANACEFYVVGDGPFDIHYVDTAGNEISLEEAAKVSKRLTTAKKMASATEPAH